MDNTASREWGRQQMDGENYFDINYCVVVYCVIRRSIVLLYCLCVFFLFRTLFCFASIIIIIICDMHAQYTYQVCCVLFLSYTCPRSPLKHEKIVQLFYAKTNCFERDHILFVVVALVFRCTVNSCNPSLSASNAPQNANDSINWYIVCNEWKKERKRMSVIVAWFLIPFFWQKSRIRIFSLTSYLLFHVCNPEWIYGFHCKWRRCFLYSILNGDSTQLLWRKILWKYLHNSTGFISNLPLLKWNWLHLFSYSKKKQQIMKTQWNSITIFLFLLSIFL